MNFVFAFLSAIDDETATQLYFVCAMCACVPDCWTNHSKEDTISVMRLLRVYIVFTDL